MAKKRATRKTPTRKPAKTSPSGVVCACCPGWPIKYPERCSNTLVRGGKMYYFCTKRCKEKFEKNPGAYTR